MTTATKATHTPGPWEADDNEIHAYSAGRHIATAASQSNPSDGGCGDRETAANVRLMAAAPDLLVACQRMVRAHDENWKTHNMDFPPIDDARAAIAKATQSRA